MNLVRLKQAEKAFLHRYPGGFENPEIIAIRSRKHKPEEMIALAQKSFSREKFQHPEQIIQNMMKVISRSSIISVFEKIRFRDLAYTLSAKDVESISNGLEELLYGTEQIGFEIISELLKSRKLAKWSLMTVCQTYFHPQRDVFIKPTPVKGVIEHFELNDLQYKPTPAWAFYEAYRSTFYEMKSNVDKSLSPTNPAFSGFLLMSIHGKLL